MILDAQNEFSKEQDVAAPGVSDNVIDTKVHGNLGVGEPMSVIVVLPQGTDGSDGDEVYSIELQASSDEAFTSPISVISKSVERGLSSGSKVVIGVPADDSGERFYRLNYSATGTSPSMQVSAYLVPQSFIQNDYKFASGYSIAD